MQLSSFSLLLLRAEWESTTDDKLFEELCPPLFFTVAKLETVTCPCVDAQPSLLENYFSQVYSSGMTTSKGGIIIYDCRTDCTACAALAVRNLRLQAQRPDAHPHTRHIRQFQGAHNQPESRNARVFSRTLVHVMQTVHGPPRGCLTEALKDEETGGQAHGWNT